VKTAFLQSAAPCGSKEAVRCVSRRALAPCEPQKSSSADGDSPSVTCVTGLNLAYDGFDVGYATREASAR
jgi:hypothetical protein